MREVSTSLGIIRGEVMSDARHCLAPFPPEGAFAGCDLSGVVVKLGPNLQKDIKIGDAVGASVVGSAFPPSELRHPTRKTDPHPLHGAP
jgi:NADPH:quinone reductase-like Zn-dependent oxidoreductase